ncbi:unnamed protein product [Cunninghamella blakesleeana]
MPKAHTFKPDLLDEYQYYVFSLPKEILTALSPVEDQKANQAVNDVAVLYQIEKLNQSNLEKLNIQQNEVNNNDNNNNNNNKDDGTFSCGTCQQIFINHKEQREHFSTDWHRYNIKRKLLFEQPPVSLTEFEDLLADLSDSISGSESEDSDDDQENTDEGNTGDDDDEGDGEDDEDKKHDNDKVANLVGKQKLAMEEAQAIEDQVATTLKNLKSKLDKKDTSLTWFTVPSITSFPFNLGIYRTLLNKSTITDIEAVNKLQINNSSKGSRLWTVLMMGGGHFAGAVIDVNKSQGILEQQVNKQAHILTHKTFHRYTTRRKQGGSQSANDSGKGKAKSAGAQIRRYNELALQQDIRELLDQWKKYIDQSEMVFVHAPSGNKKIIYGYDGAVLKKGDSKISSIPFTTRRPTLSEIRRVFMELSTLKVIKMDEKTLQKHQQQIKEQGERVRHQLEKAKAKLTGIKIEDDDNDNEIIGQKMDSVLEKFLGLLKQGKANVINSYINNHPELPVTNRIFEHGNNSDYSRFPTALHIASSQGHPELVSLLLRDHSANPTIKNDIGKTAYEVAKDKATRNAFRRCMYDIPEKWSWLTDARVPSGLSPEAEKEQIEKDRKKNARNEELRLLVEQKRQQEEEERLAKEKAEQLEAKLMATRSKNKKQLKNGGYVLDPVARALRDNQVNYANLSPEAKMRLEREKRARAAEERLKRM